MILLSGLTGVVRVVVLNTVNRVRSRRSVVNALLLGELLVLHDATVFAETELGVLVRRPEVYEVGEEEDVEEESDRPLAHGSG